jgi:hypothetical protein
MKRRLIEPQHDASNFSSWPNAFLSRYPAAYNDVFSYLRAVIPDLASFENVPRGEKGKQLLVKFEQVGSDRVLSIDFKQLSDGEKCFFLSALIVASNKVNGPLGCDLCGAPETVKCAFFRRVSVLVSCLSPRK